MPDPFAVIKAVALAFCASAAVGGRFARGRPAGWVWSLAIAAGAYLGLAVLGIRPRWPIREDQHRLLGLVLPAILMIEALGGTVRPSRWLALGNRLAASLAVAPVMLYGSVHVADLAGPGSAEWPPALRALSFAGLGLVLFGVWSSLDWSRRRSGFDIRAPLALAIAIGGTGLTVMLSGYATGGLVGPPLAGAIAGAAVASRIASGVGVGVVGLFGLICAGYFFGGLRADAAAALIVSPLLVMVADAPLPFHPNRRWRAAAGLAAVACVVGLVVVIAALRFAAVAGA